MVVKFHLLSFVITDGRNHKQCCKRSGVPETCDNICQFSPHDELSTDFLLCAGHVGTIANCYREGLGMLTDIK